MKIGGHYNWKYEPETRLIYLGNNWSGNGYWHQFAKADDPAMTVWCEVKDTELPMIEQAQEALHGKALVSLSEGK